MIIETKFSPEEEAFLLEEGEVRIVKISQIKITSFSIVSGSKILTTIQYDLQGYINSYDEKRLFKTKQELIASL